MGNTLSLTIAIVYLVDFLTACKMTCLSLKVRLKKTHTYTTDPMILDLISVEETDCLRRPCVQSCCEYDEVFNHQTGRCDEPVSVTV